MTDAAPRPLSRDTPLDVERRWLAMLREKGPAFRLEKTMELSSACRRLAMAAYCRVHPDASPREQRDWMLRTCYGDDVADRYFAWRPDAERHERR